MENVWLDKAEYPFTPNYFSINAHRLHYIEEGRGETILFVHGTPSWSFDFRNVIKILRDHFKCIAVDHIGFGLSDKPADYDYSIERHSQTLEKFVQEKQLHDITLVMHDFGGPIGFNFALRNPTRIKRLVFINSWLWSAKGDPQYEKLAKVLKSPLLPFVYRYLNFSPRYLLPKSFGDNPLPTHLLKHYTGPFANRKQRNGPLAFAKSLLNDQNKFQELWEKRSLLINRPVLIIWGMKDPVIGSHYLEKFQVGFPGSTAIRLETAGHFPQEENPKEVADSIYAFMKQPL